MYEMVDKFYVVFMVEVLLMNYLCDEILDEVVLLVLCCVYMLCFCCEVGSYGKDVCGLNWLY